MKEEIKQMPKTAIMGFGNPCRSDDGIAMYIIEQLKIFIGDDFPQITLFDMGTSAFEVLFELKGHERIIIVDAVINSGEPEGTLFQLPAAAIDAQIQDDPMVFLHSLKWDQALSYAKKILREEYPNDIQVYLIAVENTKLDIALGDKVKEAGDKLIEILKKDILGV